LFLSVSAKRVFLSVCPSVTLLYNFIKTGLYGRAVFT